MRYIIQCKSLLITLARTTASASPKKMMAEHSTVQTSWKPCIDWLVHSFWRRQCNVWLKILILQVGRKIVSSLNSLQASCTRQATVGKINFCQQQNWSTECAPPKQFVGVEAPLTKLWQTLDKPTFLDCDPWWHEAPEHTHPHCERETLPPSSKTLGCVWCTSK